MNQSILEKEKTFSTNEQGKNNLSQLKRRFLLTFAGLVIIVTSAFNAVSCNDKDEFKPLLTLSTSELTLKALTSVDSFAITSNTVWTIASSESWLQLNNESGEKNQSITITAKPNPDTIQREATITVSVKGLDQQTITVKQNGATAVSSSSVLINPEANSNASVRVISSTNWSAVSKAEWLTVNPETGTNTAIIKLTATNNADTAARMAAVYIISDEDTLQTISVKQLGTLYTISVSRNLVTIGPEANAKDTFAIKSNTTWEIKNSNTWLTIEPLKGSGDAIVTANASGQIISKLRTANLTISGDMVTKSKTLRVSQTGIPCVTSDDNVHCNTNGCASPAMPTYVELTDNRQLPDPFTFLNGSPVTTKDEWTCRQNEIAALAEEFEYGYKPCTPYDATTATLSGNILTVTVTGNGKTISFNCTITYPKNGTAPYPAMIGIGYSFLNNAQLSDWGVAVINFPNDEIGQQTDASSRGKGKFYDFFCPEHSAGALMAWSWGVSRLIDALEKTPDANIDTHHLGVTGCSRNGKGALCAGAYDERIALTIPQESGSGGAASWRVSDFQGSSVQCLNQIVTENCWFRKNFSQFSSTAKKLPFDHHMIAGLCAPRGLLIIENTSMTWLGNISTWTTGNAAHKIWEALGVPYHMGYSQFGHSDHCGLPTAQEPDVEAFVKRFLLGDETQNTNIMKTDGGFTFDEERWINWTVPTLQ